MSGILDVKLPGQEQWLTIRGGDSFEVPAKSRFNLVVKEVSDYCCSYLEEK